MLRHSSKAGRLSGYSKKLLGSQPARCLSTSAIRCSEVEVEEYNPRPFGATDSKTSIEKALKKERNRAYKAELKAAGQWPKTPKGPPAEGEQEQKFTEDGEPLKGPNPRFKKKKEEEVCHGPLFRH